MNIIVKPTSSEDFFFIEEILKKMQIPYEKEAVDSIELSQKQIQSVIRGIEQADKGQLKSNSEVQNKARMLCGM